MLLRCMMSLYIVIKICVMEQDSDLDNVLNYMCINVVL